jgi:hypothetical protein
MPTSDPFPINNFQNADGSPVANGILRIRLAQDEQNSVTQVQLTYNFVDFPLDNNGNSGTITLPVNSGFTLLPSLSYYVYEVYNSNGLRIAGPNIAKVT